MNFFRNLSLIFIIPFCLISIYLAMAFGGYYYDSIELKQQLAEQKVQQFRKDLFRMRYVVESAVKEQDYDRIQKELALISTDMNMMAYVILDSSKSIHFANHIIWQNSDAMNVLEGYSDEVHKFVVESSEPQISINFERLSIQGYYPISEQHFAYSPSLELIYFEYDISHLMSKASKSLLAKLYKVSGIGVIILVLFCVVLYWFWLLPINRLSLVAKHIDDADFHAGIYCFAAEITKLRDYLAQVSNKLKRNQKRLNDAEQRWLFSVEGLKNGLWDWNLSNGDVFVSDRWKEILGYQSYELDSVYSIWESCLHREEKADVLNTLQQCIDGETEEYESVHRLRHKDGHYVWVLDKGKIVEWDELGNPVRIIGSITDVSVDVKNQHFEIENDHAQVSITDLMSRDTLADSLYDLQVFSRKVNQYSAILIINLDNYKLVSDALGQECCDRLLMKIAARLSGAFSSSGLVARLGTDEFIMFAKSLGNELTHANKRALALASEVRQLIGKSVDIAEQHILISARVGVVLCDGGESLTPQTLLARADNALELAKEAKFNGCAIFDPKTDENSIQPFKLNHELALAASQDQIQLVYQPVVDKSGNLISVEVLPRWCHEQHGFISPKKFIAAAESSDYIFELELWIIDKVCHVLLQLAASDVDTPIMSINISSRHFHQEHFLNTVLNKVESLNILPSKIQFELNEDIFYVNQDAVKSKINALQHAGFHVALDNFGAGQCALHQLQGVRFSQVKLAGSYIEEAQFDNNRQTLLCAIVELASRLNYSVIAKQVETKSQLNHLIHAKCSGYQGYLFSRPLSQEDLVQLVKSPLPLSVV
ncbi:putative bifunctional diguanylate cyclase/phosphodiesterase [Shewanella gaetbuli]